MASRTRRSALRAHFGVSSACFPAGLLRKAPDSVTKSPQSADSLRGRNANVLCIPLAEVLLKVGRKGVSTFYENEIFVLE
jgi:hypothetical protein